MSKSARKCMLMGAKTGQLNVFFNAMTKQLNEVVYS